MSETARRSSVEDCSGRSLRGAVYVDVLLDGTMLIVSADLAFVRWT